MASGRVVWFASVTVNAALFLSVNKLYLYINNNIIKDVKSR